MGRELQKHYGQAPQTVMMMPLLEGLDGVKKMSKSLGNYIGVAEAPASMFGKIMSISDDLMWRYIDLLSFKTHVEKAALKKQVNEGMNPRDIKMAFGLEIVERFHSKEAANEAKEGFIKRFSDGNLDDIPLQTIVLLEMLPLMQLLKQLSLTQSTSESLRLIEQGAVKINKERIQDPKMLLNHQAPYLIQVGKKKAIRVMFSLFS
jgi:tyrosyl-tRNA synthetase